jgi:hypothetical protein
VPTLGVDVDGPARGGHRLDRHADEVRSSERCRYSSALDAYWDPFGLSEIESKRFGNGDETIAMARVLCNFEDLYEVLLVPCGIDRLSLALDGDARRGAKVSELIVLLGIGYALDTYTNNAL